MQLKFWGVRGTTACPYQSHLKYGGNTSCVSVQCDDHWFIFDAGSGIKQLGTHLLERGVQQAHLLFSHFHWDHIQGFPFFAPLYQPSFQLSLHAGNLHLSQSGLQEALSVQMAPPFFPVSLNALNAKLTYHDFRAGEAFDLEGKVHIKTYLLNHPQGSTAYRLQFNGRSICYVTDVEHEAGSLDEALLGFIENADLVIYDSTYSDDDFYRYAGWGHSTWQQGIRLCQAARVRQLAIFHHDPENSDTVMDVLADKVKDCWELAFVAQEGQTLQF